MGFVHLHVHGEHSFLDGLSKTAGLVEVVAENGQDAVALTDHGNVSGHLELQKEAAKRGIKPLFGIETYFCDDRHERSSKKGQHADHMTLLAISEKGLQNLWALASMAFIEGFRYDPRIDWELLERYSEGIVGTGGCLSGSVAKYLKRDEGDHFVKEKDEKEKYQTYNPDVAYQRANRFREILEGRFYLELHTFRDDIQHTMNNDLVAMGRDLSIPLIAVSDSHYLRGEDWEDHEIMTAIQMGKTYDDPKRYQYGPDQLCVFDEATVAERLSYLGEDVVKEAIANTQAIADSADVEIEEKRSMPVFYDTVQDDTVKMWDLAIDGFERKVINRVPKELHKKYRKQLEYELEIITSKGFPGYFLLVWDVIKWSKDNGILIGPSRGSVGGSLLSYVMDITEIDPIRYKLIFERFLDPGRDSLPDIDIDVPQQDRQRVREYLESKYGKHSVATIGTLSRLTPKSLLEDLCRGLKIDRSDEMAIKRLIDQVPDLETAHIETPWQGIMESMATEFRPWINKHPRLFDLMGKFSGHIRHAGAHAAGLVVSKDDLIGAIPLRTPTGSDELRTMFEAEWVEYLGYVKLDLLGLRNLSTLDECLKLVNQRHPEDNVAHYDDWQYEEDKYYNDQQVFESVWNGKTLGIFQLETAGFRTIVKWFKPSSIEEWSALIAINRPGNTRAIDPDTGLTLINLYREKMEGKRQVTYMHPLLEKVVGETYGNFVYQEQIMETCAVLAGYDLSETDRVRKILGKKQVEKMGKERQIFVDGCKRTNDIDPTLANQIFDVMEKFAEYGFNKAHSLAYALVGYWCAWMKHHYPLEFMTALFATTPTGKKKGENTERMSAVLTREARRLGIDVTTPDVNESGESYTITTGNRIRYGLAAARNVGNAGGIIASLAPFESMKDFVERTPGKIVNKKVVESLAACGAMDSLIDEDLTYPEWWEPNMRALYCYWVARGDFAPKLPKREEDGKNWTKTRLREAFPDEEIDFTLDGECVYQYIDNPRCNDHSNFEHYCFGHVLEGLGLEYRDKVEEFVLGTCLSVDPLSEYLGLIESQHNFPGEEEMLIGEICRIGGMLLKVKPTKTRKGRNPGQKMAHLNIDIVEGGDDNMSIVCFPDVYKKYEQDLVDGVPILMDVEKLPNGGLCTKRVFRLDKLEA